MKEEDHAANNHQGLLRQSLPSVWFFVPMEAVREQYAELTATLEGFEVSVSDALSRAEEEFVESYRVHMVEVHSELQELRDKLSEARVGMRKDDQMQQLERDLSWYREEAAQQTATLASIAKDRAFVLKKRETLRSETRWLQRQFKAAKKQERLLEADYEDLKKEEELVSLKKASTDDGGPRQRRRRLASLVEKRDDDDPVARRIESDIRRLRRELETTSREALRLRGDLVAERARFVDFEDFYSQCVADVVNKRRTTMPPPETFAFLGDLMFPARDLPWGTARQRVTLPSSPKERNRTLEQNQSAPAFFAKEALPRILPSFDDTPRTTTKTNLLGLDDDVLAFIHRSRPTSAQEIISPPEERGAAVGKQ